MSRVPAVVAPMMALTIRSDQVTGILAADVPSLSLSAVSFQAAGYFDTGPTIQPSVRFERLLI